MKVNRIFLLAVVCLGLVIPSAFAGSLVSDNGLISIVNDNVDANVSWVWVKVSKEDKQTNYYFQPVRGGINQTVGLKYGSGTYKIQIYQTSGQKTGTYQLSDEFSAENRDSRSAYQTISGDSSFVLTDRTVPNGVRWLWIQIIKDDKKVDTVLQPVNGYFEKRLFLNYGPGEYQVSVWQTDGQQQGNYSPYDSFLVSNRDSRDMTYLMPSESIESGSPLIVDLASQITYGLSSDYEKTKAIHDWVANHIAYDVEAVFSNTVREYTALETMQTRKAICNGYANLTVALNRAAGIRARVIAGYALDYGSKDNESIFKNMSENHVWVETWANNRWILQDTCWDAGGVNENRQFEFRFRETYFDMDTTEFAKTHTKTKEVSE